MPQATTNSSHPTPANQYAIAEEEAWLKVVTCSDVRRCQVDCGT